MLTKFGFLLILIVKSSKLDLIGESYSSVFSWLRVHYRNLRNFLSINRQILAMIMFFLLIAKFRFLFVIFINFMQNVHFIGLSFGGLSTPGQYFYILEVFYFLKLKKNQLLIDVYQDSWIFFIILYDHLIVLQTHLFLEKLILLSQIPLLLRSNYLV